MIPGTCTTCHNTPNVGNHSVPLAIDIGLNDPARRTPDMPLFLLVNKTTNATVLTMDPGRALITGSGKTSEKRKARFSARFPAAALLPQRIRGDAQRCREFL